MTACSLNRGCEYEDGHPGLCKVTIFGEGEGWRAWTVIGPPGNPRLRSQYGRGAVRDLIWPTDRWMVAKCPAAPSDPAEALLYQLDHRTPNPDCSCGIYAARNREHLLDLSAQGIAYQAYTRDQLAVIGRTGLAGRVIKHVNGFKAAKARIVELYVPAAQWHYAEGLGAVYGVPVVLDNTWSQVVSGQATKIGG